MPTWHHGLVRQPHASPDHLRPEPGRRLRVARGSGPPRGPSARTYLLIVLGEHLLGRGGVAVQKIDRGHCQELGRGQVGEPRRQVRGQDLVKLIAPIDHSGTITPTVAKHENPLNRV